MANRGIAKKMITMQCSRKEGVAKGVDSFNGEGKRKNKYEKRREGEKQKK